MLKVFYCVVAQMREDIQTLLTYFQGNLHFYKKLPPGCEGCIVLIGEVDYLQKHVLAFTRLRDAQILEGATEVNKKRFHKTFDEITS